jgi:hypothetical protein
MVKSGKVDDRPSRPARVSIGVEENDRRTRRSRASDDEKEDDRRWRRTRASDDEWNFSCYLFLWIAAKKKKSLLPM